MYTGTVIKESLEDESILKNLTKTDERVTDVDNPAPDQPQTWTLYKFTVEDAEAGSIAKSLSSALKKGTWYIDMNNGAKSYVVFSGRIFEYDKDDTNVKKAAQEYGRSLGIPEKQLDWKS